MFSFLAGLIDAFAPFGQIKIIWPGGKDNRSASYSSKGNFILGHKIECWKVFNLVFLMDLSA